MFHDFLWSHPDSEPDPDPTKSFGPTGSGSRSAILVNIVSKSCLEDDNVKISYSIKEYSLEELSKAIIVSWSSRELNKAIIVSWCSRVLSKAIIVSWCSRELSKAILVSWSSRELS